MRVLPCFSGTDASLHRAVRPSMIFSFVLSSECSQAPLIDRGSRGLLLLSTRVCVFSIQNNERRSGKLGDVYIPRDMRTGDPRGFAFVRYLEQRDADDAIDRLDGERLNGRELRIQVRTLRQMWPVSCPSFSS